LNYGKTAEEYLQSGVEDVKNMDSNLLANNYTERTNQRVLDLGCGCARMLRNVNQCFTDSELWGLDIDSKLIYWCRENIGNTANYATTTLIPHLPFESNYFNLIYCGSVFTHIDDLAEAWLMEVRRVLKQGGIFYVTIHDESSVRMLDNEYKHTALAQYISKNATYNNNKHNFGMLVIDRDNNSMVFFSKAYFKQWVEPFFDVLQIIDGAYGYQSVAVLRKK
jgi:ubiquinone/menaquinone biosynthesis C-methylase UbiE